MSVELERSAPQPPPEKPEAEASLLGSILLDGSLYGQLLERRIAPADLSRDAHRLVLGAMSRVAARGEAVDHRSVQAELERASELEAIGGPQFLVGLVQNVPSVMHAETYATIVERTAVLRRLIRAANDIAHLALTRDEGQAAVQEAQATLFSVSESMLHRDIVSLEVALHRYVEQMASRVEGQRLGVPTGLANLDGITGGLQPSDLILIGGRPGLGKTSLALNIVEHAALARGKTCAVFSMEMSEMQVVQRLISLVSEIDGNRLRRGRLSIEELQAINRASDQLLQAPIYIEESSRLTVTDIFAKSRRLQAERGLDLLVIDYLQLIEGAADDENRVVEVANISRSLKAIARELQVPVIALSQLSRQIETRGTEPMLSDLRECVTGDTRVVDAETGRWVEVRELRPGMRILSVDAHQKIGAFELADVWSTGVKPVFKVTTQTGRQLRATANHPFLTARGWQPLGSLRSDDLLATARRLPEHGRERPDRAEHKKGRRLVQMWGEAPKSETRPGIFALPREMSTHLGSLQVGWKDQHKRMRRSTALLWAEQTGDETLRTYAESDLLWERIRSIERAAEEETFDVRVPGVGTFVANGIVVHNSGGLEADADLVMFLWQKDQNDRRDHIVRLKLAKHRNGPTAELELHFEPEVTRFRDLGEAREGV